MATIDEVYAKLLEVEATVEEIKTAQATQAIEITRLKAGQKELDGNLTKRIALMGTEISRIGTIVR